MCCVIAKAVARNVDDCVPGFGGVQKFELNFQSSDMPCMTPSVTAVTNMPSVTNESVNQSQSECHQPLSEHASEAEGSDVGGEKISVRKPTKLKTDSMIPATTSSTEW